MKYFTYFFFWGESIKNDFKKFAPKLDTSKIKIIGNPKLDIAKYIIKNKVINRKKTTRFT